MSLVKMLLSPVIAPVVSPILPHWLYMRFKIYRFISSFRRENLMKKYKKTVTWEKEPWIVISDNVEDRKC